MPYIIPSATAMASPVSASSSTSTYTIASPRSAFSSPTNSLSSYGRANGRSHPPLTLSITRAAPAPVPAHTPFTPPTPVTPPLASSSAYNAAGTESGYLYPPPPAPALVKAYSDSFASSSSPAFIQVRSHSHSQSHSQSQTQTQTLTSQPPSMRRAASASSASPTPTPSAAARAALSAAARYANAAGRGLPNIPRRRGASSSSLSEQNAATSSSSAAPALPTETDTQVVATKEGAVVIPARGRSRSRFMLSDEVGKDADAHRKPKSKGTKESKRNEDGVLMDVEERAARKRPISAERTRALKIPFSDSPTSIPSIPASAGKISNLTPSELQEGVAHREGRRDGEDSAGLEEHDHSDSGSECATPTPRSVARGQRAQNSLVWGDEEKDTTITIENQSSSIPGIAPRARRGRQRDSIRRRSGAVFGEESEGEPGSLAAQNETSTVVFPSSRPSSPPSAEVLDSAIPQATPFSSPQDNPASSSLTSKRNLTSTLHIDLGGVNASGAAERDGSQDDIKRPALHMRGSAYLPAPHAPLGPRMQMAPDGTISAPPGSPVRTLSESASMSSMPLIRKKSGEVLKSSLKSRSSSAGARHRPSFSLTDLASLPLMSPSLSAPTTPQAGVKMVHFDAKLEHVRLFLAEQKPAAVSRGGSPTLDDTTSGGEGDSSSEWNASELFFSSAFTARPRPRRLVPGGKTSDEEAAVRRILMMRVLNMPVRLPPEAGSDGVDVLLEGIYLAEDAASVQGTVRVKNIAFEKNIAVRFTFDGWQTTSEVLARWAESCAVPVVSPSIDQSAAPDPPFTSPSPITVEAKPETKLPSYDRFEFSIRLADMLLRIDEKTLVLAIRYRAAGREMWDNNGGQNYRAVFERRPQMGITLVGSAVVAPVSDAGKGTEAEAKRPTHSDPGSGSGTSAGSGSGSDSTKANALGMTLHSALEKSGSKTKDDEPDLLSPSKRAADPLASRYDLGASLKNRTAYRPSFEHALTWAGHGQGRDGMHQRGALPWGKQANTTQTGGSSMASTGNYSKARTFESHSVSFNARSLSRGSPRDSGAWDDVDIERYSRTRVGLSSAVRDASDVEEHPFSRHGVENRASVIGAGFGNADSHVRNHHRSYFDAWAAGATYGSVSFGQGKARLTPPGSPSARRSLSETDADSLSTPTQSNDFTIPTSPGRHHSFPPLSRPTSPGAVLSVNTVHPWTDVSRGLGLGLGFAQDAADSEVSTPSITSVSSPCSPPDFSMLSPLVQTGLAYSDNTPMDSSSYNVFLNRFCFYTGRDRGLVDMPADMRRSYSASSVEEMLSSPTSSSMDEFPFVKGPFQFPSNMTPRSATPTMPASSGDLSPGARTPTSATFLKSELMLPTRVHG